MPLTVDELQERISAAAASAGSGQRTPLEPIGGGTKRGYGRAVEGAQPLDVGGLKGIGLGGRRVRHIGYPAHRG